MVWCCHQRQRRSGWVDYVFWYHKRRLFVQRVAILFCIDCWSFMKKTSKELFRQTVFSRVLFCPTPYLLHLTSTDLSLITYDYNFHCHRDFFNSKKLVTFHQRLKCISVSSSTFSHQRVSKTGGNFLPSSKFERVRHRWSFRRSAESNSYLYLT